MTADAKHTTATGATDAADSTASAAAAIRVSGSPSPEELAALVVVLSALGDGEAPPEGSRSAWSDPSWRLVGPSARHGGWRSTGLPR